MQKTEVSIFQISDVVVSFMAQEIVKIVVVHGVGMDTAAGMDDVISGIAVEVRKTPKVGLVEVDGMLVISLNGVVDLETNKEVVKHARQLELKMRYELVVITAVFYDTLAQGDYNYLKAVVSKAGKEQNGISNGIPNAVTVAVADVDAETSHAA